MNICDPRRNRIAVPRHALISALTNAKHVEATAQSAANVREGMIKVRVLDAIVRNRYHNNPGKLAAWTSASHVEKPPKKKKPTLKL